jgi:hypothetical protein
MGSMAMDACVSQYASDRCFGESDWKLLALTTIKPTSPARAIRGLFAEGFSFCANAVATIAAKQSRAASLDFMPTSERLPYIAGDASASVGARDPKVNEIPLKTAKVHTTPWTIFLYTNRYLRRSPLCGG